MATVVPVPALGFEILGPLRVVDAAADPVELGGLRARCLLAALVLSANRLTPVDRLIDDLWDGEPPRRARNSIQVQISQLRRRLGADRISTEPTGYRLVVSPDELDAEVFARQVQAGQAALQAGDAEAGASTLRAALERWRGPALSDLADRTFVLADAARLDESRVAALELRIDADLACGRHRELIGELEGLTADHPLRERVWAARIVALYRAGRQADALRAYSSLRTTLRDELGIEPTPELQRLELDVLAQAASLDWVPASSVATSAPPAALPPAAPSPDPVRAPYEPVSLPLSPALQMPKRSPFVGRDDALARLERAFRTSCAGRRQAVLVGGEPGIGKTRLVAELAAFAHRDGALVLYGRCDHESVAPFQPVVEALTHLVRHRAWATLPVEGDSIAAGLARLTPALIGDADGRIVTRERFDPDTERYRLFEAVADLFAALAGAQPVVLVLDDLHWADQPTLLLLRHLLRRLHDRAILVLATYRDDELGGDRALAQVLGDLRREKLVDRLALTGLGAQDVADLACSVAGRAIVPALAGALYDGTSGNPFFVEELVRHLIETGELAEPRGDGVTGAVAAMGIPEGVRDVVERRVGRLSEDAAGVLTVAAVVGRVFDLEVLEDVSGLDGDRVIDALDGASQAHLVAEVDDTPGRYTFTHALIRENLYRSLSTPRRVRLHGTVAASLETHRARKSYSAAELALHFRESATPSDLDKAIEYGELAAAEAIESLAYEEAAAHYERTLVALHRRADHDDDRRGALLLSLGHAWWSAGRPDRAEATYSEAMALARQRGDGTLFASAVLGHSNTTRTWTEFYSPRGVDDGVELLEQGLKGLPDRDSELRAALLGRLAVSLYWSAPLQRRKDVADDAVAMARRLGDDAVLIRTLVNRHLATWGPGPIEPLLEDAREILQLAQRSGHRTQAAEARVLQVLHHLELGDVVAADHAIEKYAVQAEQLRQPYFQWHTGFLPALRAMMDGRFDEAEQLAAEALGHGEQAQNEGAIALWGLQMMWLWREQGRADDLATVLEGITAVSGDIAAVDAARVWVATELGDLETARHVFDELAADDFRSLPRDLAWLGACALLASSCAAFGDRRAAEVLYRMLLPHAGANILVWAGFCAGPVDHYLGLLAHMIGEPTAAQAHFDEALRRAESMGAKPLVARVQRDYATLLLDESPVRDTGRALELLASAHATATGLGMRRLVEATITA